MRRLPWMLACLVAAGWLPALPSARGLESSDRSTIPFHTILELEQTARLLAILLDSGRAVVNDNQTLLDDPTKAHKGFTPEAFEGQLRDMFRGRSGINLEELAGGTLSPRSRHLLQELVTVSKQVIADAQAELNRQGAGFKGFIPAVFGSARVHALHRGDRRATQTDDLGSPESRQSP
jgi:hypothetical protein